MLPEARDAQLPVAHVEQMSERALHAARVQKRRHALKHQEKCNRGDEIRQVEHEAIGPKSLCGRSALTRLGGAARSARILEVFEELAVGRDDEHIAVLAE